MRHRQPHSVAVPPALATLKRLRLNQAVDMMLEYLLASKDKHPAADPANDDHRTYSDEAVGTSDAGGSSKPSKSARRTRRPPPDLSS
jgi:hypothetical protein